MDDHEITKKPPSMWEPSTDPYEVGALNKLGEEINELGSALSRCLVQGIDECDPVTGKVNRRWLEDEIADVLGKFDEIIPGLDLDRARIEKRRKAKFDFHIGWYNWLRNRSPKYKDPS